MFVSSSKYNRLEAEHMGLSLEHQQLVEKYNRLHDMWEELVTEINEKGGRNFLDGKVGNNQLSDEDIKKLIILCHPDKHNGKHIATEMTMLLNKLR